MHFGKLFYWKKDSIAHKLEHLIVKDCWIWPIIRVDFFLEEKGRESLTERKKVSTSDFSVNKSD